MNIKKESRIEKSIKITETDIVNGGEVLVLIAYAVKENEDMWSYPSPQIFNQELYLKNKNSYDNVVRDFRLNCDVI